MRRFALLVWFLLASFPSLAAGWLPLISASGGGGGPITFVADGGYNSNGAASVALTKPAGTLSGHLLVAFVAVQDSGGTTRSSVNTLAGWTAVTNISSPAGFVDLYVFYKVAGGSEPSTYTFTGSAGSGATIGGMDGDIRDYSGTATSGSIVNYATGVGGGGGSNAVVPTFSGHETFQSGELYVGVICDVSNTTTDSTSPVLSNVYSNSGVFESFYIGNYAPGSVPGTETFTSTGWGDFAAIGLTLLKP